MDDYNWNNLKDKIRDKEKELRNTHPEIYKKLNESKTIFTTMMKDSLMYLEYLRAMEPVWADSMLKSILYSLLLTYCNDIDTALAFIKEIEEDVKKTDLDINR